MNERVSRIIRTLFLCLAWMLVPVFLGLAIIGGYEAYSPVPMGDMWNGTLGFYVNASHGDWSSWWAQHNEHRILLSRILFWMEEAWFSGKGLFLLVTNYLLVAGVAILFFFIWIRGTVPRFRYDQLMRLGWKIFLPFSLLWVILTAGVLVAFGWLPS